MYSPRHARPSCLPVRATLSGGLAALLLPIALASPAVAAGPAPTTVAAGTTAGGQSSGRAETVLRISATRAGTDGRSAIGARLLTAAGPVKDAEVVIEARRGDGWEQVARLLTDATGLGTGSLPVSQTTTLRASYAGSASRAPQVSASTVVEVVQQTSMRISATPVGADGRSTIGVRLLADGRGFPNGHVQLEAATGSGWRPIGRLLSNAQGLGTGSLPFSQTTRIRATYAGSGTRTASTSPELVVQASSLGQRVLREAARHEGKPYRYGATGPHAFDCSGFIGYVYRSVGKSLPRTSQQQANATQRIPKAAKQPGDLLFFTSGGRVSHVGIYAGNGQMWAAPTTGRTVNLQRIYSSSYAVGRV